ncbi:MAG: TRAP transporter substrate-binding protein DctP [Ignavibacteriae bacterium]|nr:TRAP transporter substrate-binding protein DctP [Ignavibacteriota bacterium]MCB9214374.1 TRAP transporter substrate-binding protein DctP [Ignavibacteria bacterium]
MKRRKFIRTTALGAASGALVVSGCGEGPGARRRTEGTSQRKQVQWRLASSFPGALDILYGAAKTMAERVSTLTGGNFEIKTYQGGELVPPLEVLEATGRGSVEMAQTASYYFIGKNPAFAFDCTVPFGLTVRQQNAWMYYGGGLELMRELFADFNVINFPGGNTGAQMGGWFREPFANLSELKGRKMRIPGLGGKVMEALGVTAQVIPGSEVYIALERGAIDAAEWVGPYDDVKLGLHQVAKNYYYPGWWEPGPMLSYYVNRDAYEKLPAEYKAALEVACAESNVKMVAAYDAGNAGALKTVRDAGVVLRPFPDDVMRAARQAATQIMEDQAAADPVYAKVYAAFKMWRDESAEWLSLAEDSYTRFMFAEEKRS